MASLIVTSGPRLGVMNSAYVKQEYILNWVEDVGAGDPEIVAIEVEYLQNGAAIGDNGTFQVIQRYQRDETVPLFPVNRFRIRLDGIIKPLLGFSIWQLSLTDEDDVETWGTFNVRVRYLYIDSTTGLIETDATWTNFSDVDFTQSIMEIETAMALDEFHSPGASSGLYRFLSNKPNTTYDDAAQVSTAMAERLAYIVRDMGFGDDMPDYLGVELYSDPTTMAQDTYWDLVNGGSDGFEGRASIGVGPLDLQFLDAGRYMSGYSAPVFTGITWYRVALFRADYPPGNFFEDGDDGTFEAKINNIAVTQWYAASHDTSTPITGSGSLQVLPNPSPQPSADFVFYGVSQLAVTAGVTYRAIADVAIDPGPCGQGADMNIRIIGYNGVLASTSPTFLQTANANFTVTQAETTWTPSSSGNTRVGFWMFGGDVSGCFSGVRVDSLKIEAIGGPGYEQVTEWRYYKMIPDCADGQAARVHFVNQLGGVDSYTFTGNKKEGATVTSAEYETPFEINNNGLTWSQRRDNGRHRINIVGDKTVEVIAENVGRAEGLWLEEMLRAPRIYFENGPSRDFIEYLPTIKNIVSTDAEETMVDIRFKFNRGISVEAQTN